MNRAILLREYSNDLTKGELLVYQGKEKIFECKTLELPWKENQNNISCIPEGDYILVERFSPKYQSHLHILNIDGSEILPRSYCLVHPANYVRQLRGCIAPGKKHLDIDGDGKIDVTSSRKTLELLRGHCSAITYFSIREKNKQYPV